MASVSDVPLVGWPRGLICDINHFHSSGGEVADDLHRRSLRMQTTDSGSIGVIDCIPQDWCTWITMLGDDASPPNVRV